ncbi:MAG: DmsE family decaheme c-type cytochrome [Geobacter sp.]|nr:DmsE family decaheme c-type cytochrome [Geobacter sp.]
MDKKANKMLLLSTLACTMLLVTGIFSLAAGEVGYVGSEKCKECHEEIAASHAKSFHAKAWTGKGEGYGCESCHGPAGDHVNNPSRETIISFGKESKQTAGEKSARCLSCHSATPSVSFWDMGRHKREDVDCSRCHSIHKQSRPEVSEPETCFLCHKDIKRDANRQSHHPIIEGKVKCSDCHNPHGTLSHGMIKAENINQLCYKCHPDKRGPFIWEHPPVEENCLTCHTPHGAKSSKLLIQKRPNLCENCHNGRHPGTPYDATAGFNGSASPSTKLKFVGRSCLNCHNQIHGSNAPGSAGKSFTR